MITFSLLLNHLYFNRMLLKSNFIRMLWTTYFSRTSMKYQVYESIITTKDTTSTNRHMICDIKATLYNIFFLMNFWDFFLEGGGLINCPMIALTFFVRQNIIFFIYIWQIPGYFSFNSRRPEKAGLSVVSLYVQYNLAVYSFLKWIIIYQNNNHQWLVIALHNEIHL